MATNNPNLRVRISADINDIKQGLALVRGEVAKFKQEASQSMDLKGLNEGFNNLRSTLAGLFAGVTVGSVFRAVIQETREASDEVAQLRAVLKSTGEQAGFTATQLTDMADKLADGTTHSSGEIVKAQTRLLSYTGIVGEQFPQALQVAIDQSARLKEGIEQSAETIGKALDKPSQGVAALTKQGFKFTEAEKERMKVLEKSGRIGEAQKIVLDALAESYGGAALAARNTFGGALTAVGSSLRELLDGSGGSGMGAATRALNELAAALKSPEVREGFNNLATGVLNAVTGFAKFMAQDGVKYLRLLAEAAAFTVQHIDVLAVAVGTYLAAQGIAAAITGIAALIRGLAGLRAALIATEFTAKGLRATLVTMGGPVTLAIAALTAALYVLYQRTQDAKEAALAHKRALEEMTEVAKTSRDMALDMARAKREEALATLQAAKASLAAARYEAAATGFAAGGGGPLGMPRVQLGEADPRVARAKAGAEAAQQMLDEIDEKMFELLTTGIEQILKPIDATTGAVEEGGKAIAKSNALLIDDISRTLSELDRLYADNAISIEDYYSHRVAVQQKLIDLQIDQARSELGIAKDLGQRRALEEQIVKLQRDRADIGVTGARDQKTAEDKLTKSLRDVELQLLELDGKGAAAARQRLLDQFKETFAELKINGKQAGIDMLNSLIDREAVKAKVDELKAEMGRITSELQGKETSVGAQVGSGMMGYGEGQRQIAEARAKALIDLRALKAAGLEAFQGLQAGSPEQVAAVAGLQEIDTQIAQVVVSQGVWKQKIEDTASASFGDFLADISTGAKSFKDAFADMVKSFVAGVARMIAQEAALRTIQSLFTGFGAGGAGAPAASVSKHHSGGIAGRGGMRVSVPVNPMVFGVAPRYHNGGIAGLAPDEVPAILQTGERVLSRRQTAAYEAARGGIKGLRVEIENRGSPSRVESAGMMQGADGSQILTLVLDAVADNIANGGKVAQAGKSRYGWQEAI